MTAEAAAACEHYWASHCYDGLSVRLCKLCHKPDWDDLRAEQQKAAAAERDILGGLCSDLLSAAVTTDGAHHKQWYLERIADALNVPLPPRERGVAPDHGKTWTAVNP